MALRTVYCVQSYQKKGRGLTKGPMKQFGSSGDALSAGQSLCERSAGVVVFSVEGDPAFDYWGEPQVLATHGEVPVVQF